jgi:Transposase IS116/IS110/IS902 family
LSRAGFAGVARGSLAFLPPCGGLIAARTAVMTAVAAIDAIDADMRRMARASAACSRLMTIPGVGQLTALAFVAAIDDPSRIRRSRDIAPIWAWSPGGISRALRDFGPALSPMNAFLTITGIFIYCVVGNGASEEVHRKNALTVPRPAVVSAPVYGNALLKLKLVGSRKGANSLRAVDWFTASDVFDLNNQDNDFIGGPVLFEATGETGNTQKLLLDGGKDGKFYLAARNNMGKWMPDSNTTIVQAEQLCNHHIHGAPVAWRKADGEPRAFAWRREGLPQGLRVQGKYV